MEISGSYTLYAPRERVWALILDPTTLARIVPGCEELEQEGPGRLRGRVSIGIASLKGVYEGALDILERAEPHRFRVRIESRGTAGTMRGEGDITLEARGPSTTIVTYQGQVELGGPIGSIGARMLNATARTLINQGFARLADALAAEGPTHGAPPYVAHGPTTSVAVPVTRSASSLAEVTWSAGLPEARPLESEPIAAEARPLEQEAPPQPAPTPVAPTPPASASAFPAPTFLMRLARRTGLSDGSSESEQRIARRLLAVGVGTLAGVVMALALARRRGII
jgi:carbon monoxide dehydrogenase subunit G